MVSRQITPENTSKDWRHGSRADRNGTPGTPVYSPDDDDRPRNADEARRPLVTSKRPAGR